MITDLFDSTMAKILTLFSVSPGSRFTRNEIKEKTILHNIPLDNALIMLLKNKILIKEKRFLSLNFENQYTKIFIDFMRKEHLRFREIPLKIYYLLMDVCSILCYYKIIERIYLFGSYVKLIHTDMSDIDLAIIYREDKKIIEKIKKDITKIEKKYNKVIELHFFEEKDLKARDPIIAEIKRNSVALF